MQAAGVAENAMFDRLMQGVNDSLRRTKIHVGNPHRQDIFGISVPLQTVCGATRDDLIKGIRQENLQG
jgi:hypothetical protein